MQRHTDNINKKRPLPFTISKDYCLGQDLVSQHRQALRERDERIDLKSVMVEAIKTFLAMAGGLATGGLLIWAIFFL